MNIENIYVIWLILILLINKENINKIINFIYVNKYMTKQNIICLFIHNLIKI